MISLKKEILDKLSSKGILAYVAVSLAGSGEASTAALASLVKAQTVVMLEGLKELAIEAPDIIRQAKRGKWQCGVLMAGAGVIVQNLDSDRYTTLVDDLKKYWDYLNPNVPFSMGAVDGRRIKLFLKDHNYWTQEIWRQALRNRIVSIVNYAAASRSDPIFLVVASLDKFVSGLLNEYGKPVEGSGKHGQAITTEQQNRLARTAFLSGQS